MSQSYPVHGRIDGPIVIIGFGSIGKGTWPLIERHFDYDAGRLTVVEPDAGQANFLRQHRLNHVQTALTPENYREVLGGLLEPGKGFCVNLSVDTSSLDLMKFCREIGVPYIDTVVEPWAGYYFGTTDNAARTNYALRQAVRDEKARNPGGTTAVSCCGANPGMVSWFVKEALLTLARDTGADATPPATREGWARLMQSLGVKGVHIAERDTQARRVPRPRGVFVNTWSVEGFIAEGFQPAELGWGTHEPWFPENGHRQETGCQAAIWLDRPGAITRVHTWCPTPGPQFGFLVTHNEAISISDYYTVGQGAAPEYRPTCHYAYHPCDDARTFNPVMGMLGSTKRTPTRTGANPMTTFTTNTDLNARGTQMLKARETAETQVWRMVDLLPALFTRTAPDGDKALAKAARREAARRSVDNLLR
jgi:homospermidine synthase